MKRHLLLAGIVGAACATGRTADDGQHARVTATVYVSQQFEVRDQDQPVKYVFNGDTRVARITGSVSANERIQKIRLLAGWNLVSLAVTASNALQQISVASSSDGGGMVSAYLFDQASGDYIALESGQTVNAGSILWIRAANDQVVSIVGEYVEPSNPSAPATGGFIPGPGLHAWPLQLPPGVTIWKFDPATGSWRVGFEGDLATESDLPRALAPGEVIYVHADEPVELSTPDPALRIVYYHQDHLGSSSAITDANGALVDERSFYPFGTARYEERLRNFETHYRFTQKERDVETRLDYFGARYLAPGLGRFSSVDSRLSEHRFKDPKAATEFLQNPQRLNHYAYGVNNPLRFVDPDGEDVAKPRKEEHPPKAETRYTLELVGIEHGSRKTMTLSVESVSWGTFRPGRPAPATTQDRGRKATSEDIHFIKRSDDSSPALMEMAIKGTQIKEATIILRKPGATSADKPTEYRVKLTDVRILSMQIVGLDEKVESFSLNAAKVEGEYPKPGETTPKPEAKP